MKPLLVVLSLSLALTVSACSSAAKKAETASSSEKAATTAVKTAPMASMECKKGGDIRSLTVVPEKKGCSLDYTSEGKKIVKASAHRGTKHCMDVLKKMEEHLTGAGFSCSAS